MEISLKALYKSLAPFSFQGLPDFCLITGRNGSGKSQLIELIQAYQNNSNPNISVDVDRFKIQIEGMSQPPSSTLDSGTWNTKINEYWTDFLNKRYLTRTIEKLFQFIPEFGILEIEESELVKMIIQHSSVEVKEDLDSVNYFSPALPQIPEYARNAASMICGKRETWEVARMVSKKARKDLEDLNNTDFFFFPPDERFLDRQHLFQSSIANIFYSYARRRHLNYTQWFANYQLKKQYECFSDKDFISNFPPPWETINTIFNRHGINYSFQEIPPDSFIETVPIDFRLIKNSNSKKIEFANLSSGEKIIISLIVKLFTSEFYKQNLSIPELLVLDEPDAFLHPELSKLLIDVLNETFVKELGIKVFVTTHSPSTVALAPEESIYELVNEPVTLLTNVKKDEALKVLTFGVPMLSIDYRNQRQVFVESPTDVHYFQSLQNVLGQHENLVFKPYFISYSRGKGNRSQVVSLVRDLRAAGNDRIFGLVDWDRQEGKENFVLVHGANERYSIENFLYDPIYLVEFFLEIGGAENVRSELSIGPSYKYYDLGNIEDNSRLQAIANWVIEKLHRESKGLLKLAPLTKVKYHNNRTLELPDWYLTMPGHELEVHLKQTFKSLEGKARSEGQLQTFMTNVISRSFPFWPVETVKIIRDLST